VGALDEALGVPVGFGDVAVALAVPIVRDEEALACGVSTFGVLGREAR
jgi:hypothetical protein